MGRLKGKVAIITGAGSGFGRASALLFAKEGAKVVVADIGDQAGKETVRLIEEAGGDAVFVHTNVADSKESRHMIDVAVKTYGKLDILFNNAGIQGDVWQDIGHMEEEVFDRYINVNLKGVWMGIHHAAAELVKSKGCIINTASVAATQGYFGCTAYGASKGGVLTITYCVANELGRFGVRCNAISPYTAATPGIVPSPCDLEGNPQHRLMEISDIANAALFLASDECTCLNGHNLLIDGGCTTKSPPFDMDRFDACNRYDG